MEIAMDPSIGLNSLPNEILHTILSIIPTRSILPLTSTSRRFHDLIIRILKSRLLNAASHKDHRLILECYHPCAKFYTPYLFCEYLDTPGLSLSLSLSPTSNPSIPSNNSNSNHNSTPSTTQEQKEEEEPGELGKLKTLYSNFLPIKPDDHRRRVLFSHPAGGEWPTLPPLGLVNRHEKFVCQDIHLESHELFGQLVTTVNLVRIAARSKPGVFVGSVGVGEGIVRVWRKWLGGRVGREREREQEIGEGREGEKEGRGILWSDSKSHVGLDIGVQRIPVPGGQQQGLGFMGEGEDPPVSYTLRYEALAVRTSQILLRLEDSLGEGRGEGRAVVMSWSS